MSSDEDGFLARWSRLKRASTEPGKPVAKPDAAAPEPRPTDAAEPPRAQEAGAAEARRAPPASEPGVDLASLPPIESIDASTDIRAFLKSGVPAQLMNAALRRAWTADPAIRDFIGLAENQWDFTDPDAIPGFGPLASASDVESLVAQAMGRLPPSTEEAEAGEGAESGPRTAADAPPAPGEDARSRPQPEPGEEKETRAAAVQQDDIASPASRRGHGRALPR